MINPLHLNTQPDVPQCLHFLSETPIGTFKARNYINEQNKK